MNGMKRGGSLSASLISYQQGSRRVRSAAETWCVNGWNDPLLGRKRAKQEVSAAGYKEGRE